MNVSLRRNSRERRSVFPTTYEMATTGRPVSVYVLYNLSLKLSAYRERTRNREEIPALLNTIVVVAQAKIEFCP